MTQAPVLIIGAGVAGMTAALDLAALGRPSVLIEKNGSIGGHAIHYTCKATDSCVKCGACLVTQKRRQVLNHPNIEILSHSRVHSVTGSGPFEVTVVAADNEARNETRTRTVATVILAAGFEAFDPSSKPYGYGVFDNVVTNLELERMLQRNAEVVRPSDRKPADHIAFIQCVGSRDAKLNHLWCSKVCCASALRMGRWIRYRRPATEISFFYIDVQSFGKDFMPFYEAVHKDIRMLRVIPGDVYRTEEDRLRLEYYDLGNREPGEMLVDLLVLSIGLTPPTDGRQLFEQLQLTPASTGFADPRALNGGIFTAGAVRGPMSIAEAVADGSRAAAQAAAYMADNV